uniref:Uncharacterized protein n=1 Tax=Octopus bimaculoides TaxID=37653 RepID=A0A0L8IH96_OCTBM
MFISSSMPRHMADTSHSSSISGGTFQIFIFVTLRPRYVGIMSRFSCCNDLVERSFARCSLSSLTSIVPNFKPLVM